MKKEQLDNTGNDEQHQEENILVTFSAKANLPSRVCEKATKKAI